MTHGRAEAPLHPSLGQRERDGVEKWLALTCSSAFSCVLDGLTVGDRTADRSGSVAAAIGVYRHMAASVVRGRASGLSVAIGISVRYARPQRS